jgi:hypothetical protein
LQRAVAAVADVFVSYRNEDREPAGRLVSALRQVGLDAWWDQDIPPNAPWEEEIERALGQARCVVVCWSPFSVGPRGEKVRTEARDALASDTLVQVFLSPCEAPLFFRERQGVDLFSFEGGAAHPKFELVRQAIYDVLEGRRPVVRDPSNRRHDNTGLAELWERLKESTDIAELRRFADSSVGTRFSFEARRRADALEGEERRLSSERYTKDLDRRVREQRRFAEQEAQRRRDEWRTNRPQWRRERIKSRLQDHSGPSGFGMLCAYGGIGGAILGSLTEVQLLLNVSGALLFLWLLDWWIVSPILNRWRAEREFDRDYPHEPP